jgi:LCP family protein required for cell wall assembly
MRLVGKVLFWLGAAVVMLAAAFAGGAYLFFHESIAATRPTTKSEKRAAAKLDVPLPHAPAIGLVIGYDHRFGELGPSRSDTIMLIRTDPATHSISMLSFPRDLSVPIYCSSPFAQFTGKINSAYATCKELGTLNTVRHLTGLRINYLITVNFRGFKQVVDKLGGVWMDVDQRYYHSNAGVGIGYRYAAINLQPGYQRLNGDQALAYVRYRHTDSDIYRNARQQLFVRSVKDGIANSFSLTSIPGLVHAITENVHLSEGGHRAPTGGTILSYAKFAYTLPAGHVFQTRIQNLTGLYDLSAPQSSIQQAVNDFTHPDVAAADNAAAAAGIHRAPRRHGQIPPREITVTVLNGNGVPGAAANTSAELAQRGYRTLIPANHAVADAPRKDYFHTEVYWNPARPRAEAAAKQLATLFGAADVNRGFPRRIAPMAGGVMTVVVLGTTFHSLSPAPVHHVPRHAPPAVLRNPGATIGALRAIRKRVPFRLELPSVIENASTVVGSPRVYPISKGRKGMRLVFKTSRDVGGYWGVEETDWTGAPILSERNFTHVIKGRRYDLYWTGSHLHMVVLRANGATYWVINSLLDTLSNETMLAIAKGLRPLGH